ncbi:SdiA-regulated domain-containing protein [Hymenobacter algoricola]|uniref:SMP-30/Gluconolactonase/LRE-like region domain-containing protein n=1 Tax=Hymenobacter algoricola TaxID=486267 RepID=A0ABP7MLD4_9BACT
MTPALFLLLLLLLPAAAARRPASAAAYDLLHPAMTYRMPTALRELSGICVLPKQRVACVEDQTGTIYVYNLSTRRIEQTIPFGPQGDYEDVAQIGQDWFVLRSDGTLFKRSAGRTTTYATGLDQANEPEGLAYNAAGKALLVACKGAAGVGSPDQLRAVYRLDPGTFRHGLKPAYVLNVAQLTAANVAVNRFAPSAVAVHPKTGHVFVAAASGNALVELDAQGRVLHVEKLPRNLFPQPEGLSFAPNGDLYISSEAGNTKTALIQVFTFRATP